MLLFRTQLSLATVALGFWFLVTGCTNLGSSGSQRGSVSPAQSTSPLTTHVAKAASLSSVNSMEIARPLLAPSIGTSSLGASDAQRIVEQVARETMTLKISAGSSSKATTGADAVLSTEILRFDERQGSAIGGEPAVVSFKMSLRSTRSGAEVWGAQYFIRQEALSDNLLKINERVGKDGFGAGWRTAHDLFQRGVTAALQDFTNQREQQFLSSSR